MENQKITYRSQTYNAGKAFLYAFPIYISGVAAIIGISILLHNPAIGVIGWILISSIPFLYQRQFKRLFTRRVLLEFDNLIFSIKEYSIKDDDLLRESILNWSDFKFYKFNFSSSNTTYLVIYLKNGSHKSFSFKDEKDQEQAINERSVFSIFHYFVENYNLNKIPEEKILLKPGFLTTKTGGLILYFIVLLAISAIIVHIILKPKTSMFSFMSVLIILGLLVKRKNDKEFYNKVSQLSAKSPF